MTGLPTEQVNHSNTEVLANVDNGSLRGQLDSLNDQDTPALRKLWQRQYKHNPAAALSRNLLIRGNAWKLQARRFGGLPQGIKRKVQRLGEQLENGTLDNQRDIQLKSGTRLVRSWHGKTYEVLVLEKGFELEGNRFKSLSAVAREITGAHWSGPRFFGLSPKPKVMNKAQQAIEERRS